MGNKIEVDEAQFLASQQLVSTVQGLLNNPEARRKVFEAQKIVYPNVPTPKDFQDDVLARVEEERTARLALEKQIADDKAKAESEKRLEQFQAGWERQKAIVAQRYPDLNEAGLAEIQKLAEERGIADFEAAGALFRQLHPPAEPAAPNGLGWNLWDTPQQDGMKEYMDLLMKSPDGINDNATNAIIRDTLLEVRGQKRAA